MHPTKAPRLDGMSAVFFQKYWDIVSTIVTNMALNVLNSHMPIADINKTNISLVPKKNSPIKMAKFRLISLSNVIYKIIAKVLFNRLKAVLPKLSQRTKVLSSLNASSLTTSWLLLRLCIT